MTGLIIDLFAGGGGASVGIEAALGIPVDVAINHDEIALAVHKANHPATRHLEADIWEVKPREATGGVPVELLWASPDCTHFSVAKGGKPRKQNIRSLAWAVTRWAKEVRPRVIFLENVSEFRGWGPLAADGTPDKKRMGETFRRWLRRLENLGYAVEYRVLDASLYGAPTRRRRLFLIARNDGQPIQWPESTHGPGLLPLRTAAECIDWSLPCPSIFERERPLAEKTLWRIAQGIRRFVLENPSPFIVRFAEGESGRGQPSSPRFGLQKGAATPDTPQGWPVGNVAKQRGAPERPIAAPTPFARLTVPSLVKVNHGKNEARGEAHSSGPEEPVPTITAGGDRGGHTLGVIAPTLIQTSYGERQGQRPRYLDLHQPLGTVVAQGQKHAMVGAFLAKHFGGVVGQELDTPASTITAKDHHALAAATLVKFRGNEENGHPGAAAIDQPMPTLTAGGNHVAEVRAFLTAYYGDDGTGGQSVLEPMRTLTTKHRLGLVTVEGAEYQIVDIGMRMLEPHELLAAQFGRFAGYDMSAARTKAAKVRLIGNSVCPEVAEAIVGANFGEVAEQERVA